MSISYRITRLIAGLTCIGGTVVSAVEPASAPPLVVVSAADVQRSWQHWDAGVVSTAWNDPGVAPLRARFAQEWPGWVERLGGDPLVILRATRSADLRVLPNARTPIMRVQADLGATAASTFAAVAAVGTAESVDGADAAITFTPLGTKEALHLVQRGTWLLLGTSTDLFPISVPATAHDLSAHVDGPALAALAQLDDPAEAALLVRLMPVIDAKMDVVAQGFALTADIQAPWPWLIAYDHQVVNRLPSTTTEVSALGIDGALLWQHLGEPLQQAWQRRHPSVPDLPLHEFGIDCTTRELVAGLSGTWVLAATPGAPIPGYTLLIPRSPIVDQIATALITKTGSAIPAEGQSLPIPLAGLPLMPTVGRDARHWVLSTDAGLVPTWLASSNPAWEASPLGQVTTAHTTAETLGFAVGDTTAQLRNLAPLLGMLPWLAPAEKQAANLFIQRLAKLTKPSWAVVQRTTTGLTFTSEGLTSGNSTVAVAAIIAAIAVPNLLESRTAANESAAVATLKASVFPAQIQFQAGAYIDSDNDGRGEFAPELALLAGKTDDVVTRRLSLMSPEFNAPQPVLRSGYRFAVYTFGEAENNFVAYAWPNTPTDGRRRFALTVNGVVYEQVADHDAPTVYSLWGGTAATSAATPVDPTWKPYTPNASRTPVTGRRTSPRSKSGNQMRQLVLAAAVYQNDNDQNSPLDLTQLIASTEGDLTAAILVHPTDPTRIDAYCYVRPVANAKADQPIIVENPAVWKGAGCLVAFCDGHVAWIGSPAAQRVWTLAQTLVTKPTAAKSGITGQDWAAVADDLSASQSPP